MEQDNIILSLVIHLMKKNVWLKLRKCRMYFIANRNHFSQKNINNIFIKFFPIYSTVKQSKDTGTFEDFVECLKLYDKVSYISFF